VISAATQVVTVVPRENDHAYQVALAACREVAEQCRQAVLDRIDRLQAAKPKCKGTVALSIIERRIETCKNVLEDIAAMLEGK
jgi:hypothetical protein